MLERLALAIEADLNGVAVIDPAGRIVLVNAELERMLGHSRAEPIGQPMETLLPERLHADQRARWVGFWQNPDSGAMRMSGELFGRRADASEFPIEIGLNCVETPEDGRLAVAAIIDISLRRQLEGELRQTNARFEEFTYVVSHDLKSPLRGINDLVEWVAEDLDGDRAKARRNIERVKLRVGRMESIIDDLLAYARAGHHMAEVDLVDPRSLVEKILEVQSPPLGLTIGATIAAAPFKTARTQLETVLRNLIGNAVKHHDRDHGHIAIGVVEDDTHCVFTVADDGLGIPVAARDRIFKLFQTLNAHEGSGIGLALTKRLVEAHGGRIALDDNGDRRGATFRVWWPRFARMDAHD